MNKILLVVLMLVVSGQAAARDDRLMFSAKDLLASSVAKERLTGEVKFYFGDSKHPGVERKFGTFTANKKTNAFGKSDQKACDWAALSALITLQNRAIKEGGNAVINIRSYYKKNEISSIDEYECGAGAIMAGVTLKGTVVKLK